MSKLHASASFKFTFMVEFVTAKANSSCGKQELKVLSECERCPRQELVSCGLTPCSCCLSQLRPDMAAKLFTKIVFSQDVVVVCHMKGLGLKILRTVILHCLLHLLPWKQSKMATKQLFLKSHTVKEKCKEVHYCCNFEP